MNDSEGKRRALFPKINNSFFSLGDMFKKERLHQSLKSFTNGPWSITV